MSIAVRRERTNGLRGLRPSAGEHLGFFCGCNWPLKLDGFWNFAERAAMGANVEVQNGKFEGPSLFISQGGVAAPQQGAVRHKAAGATKVNQPGGFRREQPRHDCGPFPYFRTG